MNEAVSLKRTPIVTLISDACRKTLDDHTSLPTMPDVAARIHDAMNDPNWSISSVATIIKGDAGTTAYLLRVANSAIYGGTSRTSEVEQAVARLGMKSTRNLVTAHALRSMFTTRSRMLGALMQQTWRTSAKLAAFSSVLASRVSHFGPDRALLAGLLQDIGILPILNALRPFHEQLTDEALIVNALDRYAATVGIIVLQRWGFEQDLIDVAKSREDWQRDSGPDADLADLVLLARLHHLRADGKTDGLPRIDELPAAAKFQLGALSEDGTLEELHQNDLPVKQIMHSLGVD